MTQTHQLKTAGFIAKIGSKQTQYNDVTILFPFRNLALLAMFDISTTKPIAKEILISEFQNTLDEALNQPDFVATEIATFILLQQFLQALNIASKGGSTSIAVAWIDTSKVWGYCAGDVRMGVISGKSLVWFSPVHTGANIDSPFTDELKQHPQRNILTRVLRPHRQFIPEFFEFTIAEGDLFLAATDGFWCDPSWCSWLSLKEQPEKPPHDDCTCIWFNVSNLLSSKHPELRNEQLVLNTKYQEIDISKNALS